MLSDVSNSYYVKLQVNVFRKTPMSVHFQVITLHYYIVILINILSTHIITLFNLLTCNKLSKFTLQIMKTLQLKEEHNISV